MYNASRGIRTRYYYDEMVASEGLLKAGPVVVRGANLNAEA
jgi:hypothetical protein